MLSYENNKGTKHLRIWPLLKKSGQNSATDFSGRLNFSPALVELCRRRIGQLGTLHVVTSLLGNKTAVSVRMRMASGSPDVMRPLGATLHRGGNCSPVQTWHASSYGQWHPGMSAFIIIFILLATPGQDPIKMLWYCKTRVSPCTIEPSQPCDKQPL